jgi:hypothetical protein
VAEETGVESLARQIRANGRAYPIFEIAQLVLKKPDRYHLVFSIKKKEDGTLVQPLWLCQLDDTLWLSDLEAAQHVLLKHFSTFYQSEKTPTDPPKGTYTFVAQCGLSGKVLGPPNYHDYQSKLRKLHAERFSRMPFEVYKSRVRIVRDEAVVKQWVEELSWKTEYICLNLPEPLKLSTREEVDQHFRETHLPNVVKLVDEYRVPGAVALQLPCLPLRELARRSVEEQRRFPLRVVNVLSQQFASHGLQFFKVNKTVTHVSVARPHYLDLETTPVSAEVRQIVQFINEHPGTTRKKVVDALAPEPAPAPPVPPAPPASDVPAPVEGAVPKPEAPAVTPQQAALIGDLHWLIHQGHVIEFHNGVLEVAKKPAPRPLRPEPKKPASSAAPVATDAEPPGSVPTQTTEVAPAAAVQTAPGIEAAPALEASATPAVEAAVPIEASAEEPQRPGEIAPGSVPAEVALVSASASAPVSEVGAVSPERPAATEAAAPPGPTPEPEAPRT